MVASISTTTNAAAELSTLQAVMSSSEIETTRAIADLRALKAAEAARAKTKATLEAKIAAATKQAKARGLAGISSLIRQPAVRLRQRARRASLGDLASGLGGWAEDQGQKINDWATQGYYATMLEAAMRLVMAPTTEPEDALRNDQGFAALADAIKGAILVDGVRVRALAALAAMRASVLHQPSALPFDRSEYDAAVEGDLRYIQSHEPNAGFFTKALAGTAGVMATLDKYVPGWGVLLDVATPVLPIAPLVSSLVGALPLVGHTAQIAVDVLPGFGRGGLMPLSPSDVPLFYGLETSGSGLVQITAFDEPLTTLVGHAGAVRFQLTKSAAQAAQEGQGVLEALERTATDLLDGYALAAELAALFVAPETAPELYALKSAIAGLRAVITLAKAIDAADKMRRAADKARAAALTKAAQDDAENSGLQAKLDALLARLGQLRARLAAGTGASQGLGQLVKVGLLVWLASEVLS